MYINIPERLLNKMGEDLKSECQNVFKKYEEFTIGDMYFFKEYTDHSYRHIQYVLETANNLIPDDTFEYLTSADIFILCLSILYHDLGMHITFYSLKSLYEHNYEDKMERIKFQELWHKFVKNKCNNEPELLNLTEIQEEKFIKYVDQVTGFIREQHPLIAELIAKYGFPIVDNGKSECVKYSEKSKEFYYELSGIVARSHGLDLRKVIEYLKKSYRDIWKTPYGCSIIYIMTLVRIADYLHITDDRINKYKLNLYSLNSKISHTEYLKHRSVYHSQTIYDNPETIYVEIHPENCNIFIGMIDLLEDIQKEMDMAWAILGEVYGDSKLKLSVRRITSNILSNSWRENSKFVAEKLRFKFDGRLLDLLIEPLYGNNASYGVRELIQNATDACKTRKIIEDDEYEPKVDIAIKDSEFIITDNGIGMDLDVIKNHFLKIGSSFKSSNEFKKIRSEYEENDKEIQRNGKFGIGILSSYLLGDTIEVCTKSKIDGNEYNFSTQKDTEVIEIEKNSNSQKTFVNSSMYGTQIKIKMKDNIEIDNLIVKEWYKFDDVDLTITIDGTNVEIDNLVSVLKNENEENEQCWKELNNAYEDGFRNIYWSYDYKINPIWFGGKKEEKKETLKPNLICNGILIPDSYAKRTKSILIEEWPTVVVYDTSGSLELNLSRDEINGTLPFIKKLEKVLMDKFVDEFINLSKEVKDNKSSLINDDKITVMSKMKLKNYHMQKILFGKNGYSLYNKYFLSKLKIRKVIRIWTSKKIEFDLKWFIDDDIFYILEGIGYHPNLKNEITHYCDKSPFRKGIIYLHNQDYSDYRSYAANLYKLSEKFCDSNRILFLEDIDTKSEFGLNIGMENVTLIIEHTQEQLSQSDDGSDIFEEYFGDNALLKYIKNKN